MADVVDPTTRSRMMSGIRGKNTKPEIALRRLLHRSGLRYRLHTANLPGRPDIVFPSRRIAIFVHGCFWHRHDGCYWCTTPSSNAEFWNAKFASNVQRDAQAVETLGAAGWRVALIWECGLRAMSIDDTAGRLLAWITSGTGDFESLIVRRREF
ncbi:DNA mismatch endonuclease of very short patch repair [Mesorhizobium prunaredense]|uniref:Very short patch repair endonuclease n=1 Tax=Mesorhizobium prunaredense TaxID=1631249 RepID=A0A1R3VBB8_9HYPH|nr:DNA mismatch endonuclease Vsr [Mesorhizobium prunaredense]SIT57200.1 DNA mismatch endonuclease of very short patch repair [Mesorhizobium prunaredense]